MGLLTINVGQLTVSYDQNNLKQDYNVGFTRGYHIYCFYKDDKKNGEYKVISCNGKVVKHCLYINGRKYQNSLSSITEEKKLILTLKYDLRWL